jgi:heme export protein D (CcmD)
MNPWPFVVGAYAFTLLGTIGLTWWSFAAMRRAEAAAAALKDER